VENDGPISAELAGFLEEGVSLLLGARDRTLFPECARACGARVEPGRREVTAFVPSETNARLLDDLRDNGRIAMCFARIHDHRSIQLKGQVIEVREAQPEERGVVERYWGELVQAFGLIGLPPRLTLRVNRWPCHAIRFRVESIFVQTPGPGAGAPLGPAGHRR
jgi:hypothetical protein